MTPNPTLGTEADYAFDSSLLVDVASLFAILVALERIVFSSISEETGASKQELFTYIGHFIHNRVDL